ncbi:hypothetical protein GOODEAATRI_013428 [Goodea atripinnis]|uniref:Secreted protein n=1 Tax=Goodea atripinnis TaxID=208336 RepID=A0ABV0MHG9_9TELE
MYPFIMLRTAICWCLLQKISQHIPGEFLPSSKWSSLTTAPEPPCGDKLTEWLSIIMMSGGSQPRSAPPFSSFDHRALSTVCFCLHHTPPRLRSSNPPPYLCKAGRPPNNQCQGNKAIS